MMLIMDAQNCRTEASWKNSMGGMKLALPCFLVLAGCTGSDDASTSQFDERIVNADMEPQNWLTHGRTYDESRFSSLAAINSANVRKLGLAWSYDLDTDRGQEATPLAVDGILYTTSAWSKVQAFEAETGKLLWQFDPEVPGETAVNACCDVVNRGVAYWDGRIFVGTLDGRLIALDAKSGQQIWSVMTVDQSKPYTITGAPRIIKGRVIIGNGGAEMGVRGYVSAYDAKTGKLDWRFYTVPGQPGKRDGAASDEILEKLADKTWSGDWWRDSGGGGGGTVWDSMAYDPELDLLYIGVGNASYWNQKYRSAGQGDNLFVSSILALRPETGEYVWHYQQVPGDEWDYTATQHMILSDIVIDGKLRKVLMQAPKNGFFYVLDRTNGKLISAEPYVNLNWASGIDMQTGRPMIKSEARYSRTGKMWMGFPSAFGAHNWQPMAYNPTAGLVYIPVQESPMPYQTDPNFKPLALGYNLGLKDHSKPGDPVPDPQAMRKAISGYLLAWNPVTQRPAWRVPHSTISNGGLLATAGDLVFQGTGDGTFEAYHAVTGKRLWRFDTQDIPMAAPITYSVADEQYITVVVGWGGAVAMSGGVAGWSVKGPRVNKSRVLTFKLNGQATLASATSVTSTRPSPPPQFADQATIAAGAYDFTRTCAVCHGPAAIGSGGAPDLRYSATLGNKAAWEAVIIDGILADRGMVSFSKNYSATQIEAMRAYVIERARVTVNQH